MDQEREARRASSWTAASRALSGGSGEEFAVISEKLKGFGSAAQDVGGAGGRGVGIGSEQKAGRRIGRPPEATMPKNLATQFPVVQSRYSILRNERSLTDSARPSDASCNKSLEGDAFLGGHPVSRRFSVVSGTVSSVRGKNAASLEGSNMMLCSQNGCDKGFSRNRRKKRCRKKIVSKVDESGHDVILPKDAAQRKAVEDFMFEMLPVNSQLGYDVVRDVLGQFEGDVPKALETLLNMASSSYDLESPGSDDALSELEGVGLQSPTRDGSLQELLCAFSNLDPRKVIAAYQETEGSIELAANNLLQADCQAEFASTPEHAALNNSLQGEKHSSLKFLLACLQKTFPAVELDTLFAVLKANDFSHSKSVDFLVEGGLSPCEGRTADPATVSKLVMETLFKPKEDKTSGHQSPPATPFEIRSDGWQFVRSKSPTKEDSSKPAQYVGTDKEEECGYDAYRDIQRVATKHWTQMNDYFQQAASAYQSGKHAYAGVLSEKGKEHQKLAREASDKGSSHLFKVKNKHMMNNITIDLHSQHVAEAMGLLKLHLESLAPLNSVHTLTVITGHGNGEAKIKPAVTRYLTRKGIGWKDENAGRLVIDMQNVGVGARRTSQ